MRDARVVQRRLLVTLDTNQLDDTGITRIRGLIAIPCEFACITVSQRERGHAWETNLQVMVETAVWGESTWGQAVWGGESLEATVLNDSPLDVSGLADERGESIFEAALRIISNGSFPAIGKRDSLSRGERRQLRDAMIFEAHVRHRRDVLVTNDKRGFVNGQRRDRLEALGRTHIVTPAELEVMAGRGDIAELLD